MCAYTYLLLEYLYKRFLSHGCKGIHFCGELSFFVFVFVFAAAAAAVAVAGMTERRIVSDGLLTFSL
jgi:hypothetical protein